MNLNEAIQASDDYMENERMLQEASGMVRQISRDEFIAKMNNYDVVGFRVVLRES